jgi:uncharacterized membrane protein
MPFGMGPSAVSVLLVILAILWILFRVYTARNRQKRRPPSDPRAVLDARLARGEITRADYDTAMRALGMSDTLP